MYTYIYLYFNFLYFAWSLPSIKENILFFSPFRIILFHWAQWFLVRIILANSSILFFPWLSRTPWNRDTSVSWSNSLLMGVWPTSMSLLIVECAAVNISLQVTLSFTDIISFQYIPWSEICESNGTSRFLLHQDSPYWPP